MPAMYVLLSKWSPRLERTQFGAFAMAGCNVGNVLGLALTGLLSDEAAGGWPLAFYTFGKLYFKEHNMQLSGHMGQFFSK